MESVYSKVWVILEPYLLTFRVVIGFVIWCLSLRIFAFRNFAGGGAWPIFYFHVL